MTLANPWKFPLHGLPLRCSVPLPQGAVADPARELALTDEHGRDVGAQWRVLSTWNDGSARFALLDYAEAEVEPRTTRRYVLRRRQGKLAAAPPRPTIRVRQTAAALTVDTGRLAWTFSKKRFTLGTAIVAHGRDWVKGQASDLCITDERGATYRASEGPYRVRLEENGPHRVIVRVYNCLRQAREQRCRLPCWCLVGPTGFGKLTLAARNFVCSPTNRAVLTRQAQKRRLAARLATSRPARRFVNRIKWLATRHLRGAG